ncbi:MAG: hypothetical protein H7Y59_19880 [Anaerolineales bacterium]|nr:hypothetical protein [Anaerolineales bacterium]
MKKNISFYTSTLLSTSFLFSLFITACAAPTSTPAQAAIDDTSLPTESVQFTPVPTFTEETQAVIQPTEDTPTLAAPVVLSGASNTIQFAANGTYGDIADSLETGTSKTYTVNAMKGQIMSVSVLPQVPDGNWGYVYLDIKGADGTVLCPQLPDTACMFWRGALPSSQDYSITLTTDSDLSVLEFVLRVAINPPGKDIQYFQYTNPISGISLTYPDTFAPSIPVYGNYKIPPELTLHLIDSKSYEKTNLSEAYLFVSSSADSQIVSTCTEPYESGGGFEQILGDEVINGLTFVHSTSDGAGAGNYYQQEIYRTVHKNRCYEVIYFMHSTNVGNYPAGTVAEFDRDAILEKLSSIFSTFTIE